MKSLPNQAKRLQEQREWMRSYEQLKAWEEMVISSDDEEALSKQISVKHIWVGYLEGEEHEMSRWLKRKIIEF